MTIERVGILGSGIMGSGIAEVAAKSGFDVVLRSRKQESADAMVASLEKSLARQVERGKLEQATTDEVRARVTATLSRRSPPVCPALFWPSSIPTGSLMRSSIMA